MPSVAPILFFSPSFSLPPIFHSPLTLIPSHKTSTRAIINTCNQTFGREL
jgi:hypothetical protein